MKTKFYGMESKFYDLGEISGQMCVNIYNLLVEKGYNPEEGVNVEKILGDPITVDVSSSFYGEPCGGAEFDISYICFNPEEESVLPSFTAYTDNPYENEDAMEVDSFELYIESLDELYDVLETLPENGENDQIQTTNENLYDEISRVLTNFEHPDETGEEMGVLVDDLYETLAKVQSLMADGSLKLTEE